MLAACVPVDMELNLVCIEWSIVVVTTRDYGVRIVGRYNR